MIIQLPEPLIEKMKETPQNPKYHGEGNVYNHTMLVFEAVSEALTSEKIEKQTADIFLNAALLHDVGKPLVTTLRKGNWSARGHEEAGVSVAREILLQYPEITIAERKAILDIVRWHHIPLRWITGEITQQQLLCLATQVDLATMGWFSTADFKGRICEDKPYLLAQNAAFTQVWSGKAQPDFLPFSEMQTCYQKASVQHKNALWKAYTLRQPTLWQKLLRAPSHRFISRQNPDFKIIMTIGTPKSGKTTFIKKHYPNALHISLGAWELDEPLAADEFVRQRRISAFQYHLSAYSRQHSEIVLEGNNLNEATRQCVSEIIKGLNGELTYLFFETSQEKSLAYNEMAETQTAPSNIEQAYKKLLYPHPWEAHSLIFAEEKR